MTSKLKIGFFADGVWAQKALSLFLNDPYLDIVFICPRFKSPDKYLKQEAYKKRIDFLIQENIKNKFFIDKLSRYKCDLFVSMSFDQIFDKSLLDLPYLGTINCHASKLPFYRGRNILNWVLINDEKEFGITVHYIDEGIDTGDIILQKTFSITDSDNYKTLLDLSFKECPLILYEAVQLILQKKVIRIPQDSINSNGSYVKRRKSGDEIINWNLNTRQIFNFIRAITSPGPCATSFLKRKMIKIISSEIEKDCNQYQGEIGQIVDVFKESFLVKTSDGYLRITNWDFESKPAIGDKMY